MDSLTQATLGAAVGEAVLGRKSGRKAMMWGAVCGTLPDLDVFVPLGDVVSDFTYHRSFSHSLLVLAALTPPMVWLILRIHPGERRNRGRWLALVYLAFATHALLDGFTVYGTQLLWPVPRQPEAWSTIFIIDPAYTVPLLIGVLAALALRGDRDVGHTLNTVGLVLATVYLAWSIGAKLHVENVARSSLANQGIAYERVLTTPAPFNTLLWRILAVERGAYHEGFYSLVGDGRDIAFTHHSSRPELWNALREHRPVRRLQWFTKGFYSTAALGDLVVITDLRMGLEPDYIFRFVVGEGASTHVVPVEPRLLEPDPPLERIGWVWARIWEPNLGP